MRSVGYVFLSFIIVLFSFQSLAEAKGYQELASRSVLLVDLKNNEILYSSKPDVVRSIASLSKMMTAVVILDAKQSLSEILSVNIRDTKEMRGVYSRVRIGSQLSRYQLMNLALMSSENRAAATLAHYYPGGYSAFVSAMNKKAKSLGMKHTHYVEPTGLSPLNVSTARDLVLLLKATEKYPLLTKLSTTKEKVATFDHPRYSLNFRNTNPLVRKPNWSIQLTKTGFTNKAGHCLMMRTVMNHRSVAFVALDSLGNYSRFADAGRLKKWLESGTISPVAPAALVYKKQEI
ncbi:UNVERIFIED_CONTAM: hypothetical protein GTU68_035408 [Idotea baltica]|nr:hypothetical protein [Idotea baltica]